MQRNELTRVIKKIFQRGLIAIAPLALTIAFIGWIGSTVEGVFGAPFKTALGEKLYFPGIGLVFFLFITFVLGTFLNNFLVQKISSFIEKTLTRIPLVKTLYNSICEMMNYFKTDENNKKNSQVVRIEIGGLHMLGLVTRENFEDLPKGLAEDGEIAVFIPCSYQIGGYTFFVPRNKVSKVDMTIEEAMRFSITAGALSQKSSKTQVGRKE